MCFGGFLDQEDNKELMIYSVFIVEEWSLQGHINYLFFSSSQCSEISKSWGMLENIANSIFLKIFKTLSWTKNLLICNFISSDILLIAIGRLSSYTIE